MNVRTTTPRVMALALAGTVAFGVGTLTPPAGATTRAASAPASAPESQQVRVIPVEGAANVRDIGGYTARDGKSVRYGIVYRSASLSKVTPAGVGALGALGLGTAVDFRSDGEVRGDGPDKLPAGVTRVAAPINPASTALLSLPPDALLKAITSPDKAAAFMELSYRLFIRDAAARKQFTGTLQRIASGNQPLLYHCTAGKDRTGTMTAILLTTLGVNRKQVYADFLRSNKELEATNKATVEKLKKAGIDPALIMPMLTVRAAYLDAAFDQIKRDYGTFDRFLVKGLGINKATQAKLRTRLLK